jgi:acetyltransferase
VDPRRKVWRDDPRQLDAVFRPRSVAIVGATETQGSVGHTLTVNLLSGGYKGVVYPINPKRDTVLGHRCYKSISDIPDGVDLAVIATPSLTVPGIIAECAKKNITSTIIISAGFKELGQKGAELEKKILEAADGRVRIIGPNCLGVMNPSLQLNATFAGRMALPGQVAFVSQSGALCTAVLDWSLREKVGFSSFVSIGSMLDVNWGDLIDYFSEDPDTKSILIYMESIGDAHAFLSAAREATLSKPVIVLKVGRTEFAQKAAMSHTGSIAGSDDVLDAAFRRCGVLRVTEIRELFYMADILAKQPRPMGPKLAILTNAGGPGVLATDALVLSGGQIAELSPETISEMDQFLPQHWSHSNPVDILGDASPERYENAAAVLAKDPGIDGLLTILTPQAMSDPAGTAKKMIRFSKIQGKPVLASWMGGEEIDEGKKVLIEAGIPVFPYPDEAAKMFTYMWQYSDNLRQLYETPASTVYKPKERGSAKVVSEKIIRHVLKDGRTLLSEHESKQILEAYGIPVVETHVAKNADEAVTLSGKFGYPVVLKLHSETITHKSDVGGIRLDLRDAAAVRQAFTDIQKAVSEKKGKEHFGGVSVQKMIKSAGGFELILGASPDAQFGPVLLFGSGGVNVEVFKDCALGLPPLNTTLARRLMERTKVFAALKGSRGRLPVDLSLLENILVRFSQLVLEQKRILEIDINPLFVSSDTCVALDARIVLVDPKIADADLPRPSIRPYPSEYISQIKMKNGRTLTLRPIRAEDEPLMVRFHEKLSDRTVRNRYFSDFKLDRRVAHERLVRVCFNDYDREIALVAEDTDIFAIARLNRTPHTDEAEFSMVITDEYQNKGLGTDLLAGMLQVAKSEKMKRVFAETQVDNFAMIRLFQKHGFKGEIDNENGTVRMELYLTR